MTETTAIPSSVPNPTPTAQTGTDAPASWYSSLPAELQADPTIAKYTSLEGAARGLIGAVKMIGDRPENLMKMPGAGDAEATRAVLHKLGLPETPEGYSLRPVEGSSQAADSELAKVFTSACFEAGVLPGAMQAVFEKVGASLEDFDKQQKAAADARETENMAVLKSQYGSALDDTLTRAEVVADKFGLIEVLNEAGLGTHPGVISALAAIFPTLQEDTAGGRPGGSGVQTKSPAEYMAEARELQAQALKEPVRSRQLELSQRALRLYQLANSGK